MQHNLHSAQKSGYDSHDDNYFTHDKVKKNLE